MDAGDLQSGFRLGDWLVEPRDGRICGQGRSYTLPPHQMRILVCLAEHHGEAVDRRVLGERAWPGQRATDEMLRDSIGALREIIGDSRHDTRCIVSVGRRGYALIAHFEPLPAPPASPVTGPQAGVALPSLAVRAQALVVELRRRSVFKVAGAYLVVMWIVLQVAETTFQPLRLPDWWMTVLTILAVLGLPIVAALAWSYEITPGGIVLDTGAATAVRLPRARRTIAPVLVTGVALMAAVTGLAWWRSIDLTPVEPPPVAETASRSIAVLPLVDMSPAGGNAYLGDGLSEELSLRLAQVPGLRVAARTSAFEFRGRNVDVRKIGQALGVRHVLEGSVRRDRDNLRVIVQLIDTTNGYHVWAGSYDRDWREVLAIQDDVARSITEALRVILTPGAEQGVARRSDVDTRAFDPYLAGLAMLRQSGDLSQLNNAARHFREALQIDAEFAPAHAGLCQVGVRRHSKTRDPADLLAAEASCKRALDLNPSLVETEKALAGLYLSGGKFVAARSIYLRLIERNPRDADGHIGLALALDGEGQRGAAEKSFREAVAVEPGFWATYNSLGGFLFERGRVDEAIEAYRRVTELTPSSASAYNNLGAALQMKGDLNAAADAFMRSLEIDPSRSAYSNLGTVHYYLGQFVEAADNYAKAAVVAGQDQTLWGNLADAQWQIPERRPEAVNNYRRAIELAERDLASTPNDVTLLAQLGYYYGRVGDADRGGRLLARAQEAGADVVNVQYLAALSAADRGDVTETLRALAVAIRLGYPVRLVKATPEFSFLERNAEFRRLTATVNEAGKPAATRS